MNKPNQRGGSAANFIACVKSTAVSPGRLLNSVACGLLLVAVLAVSASAQTNEIVDLSAVPQQVTVPLDFTGSVTVSNHVHIANGSSEVDLSVSGLPAGVGGSFDRTAFTGSGAAILTLTFSGRVADGVYTLNIQATGGATNNLLVPLEVGDEWSGASGSSLNWSDPGNWNGGIVPTTTNNVVFTAAGATTNYLAAHNLPIGTPITSIVDQNTTISSLRFAQYSTNLNSQNLRIAPNVTLSVTGTNGFTMLPDYINDANQMYVAITGASGTLAVSNKNANISTLVDNYQTGGLNLSGLGTFRADVSQIGFGDYLLYPNFFNLQSNAYDGRPYRYVPEVNLARTNIFKAAYVDPYNYNNVTNRNYSFIFGANENSATSGGLQLLLNLGISNTFLMDSLCIGGHGAEGSSVTFNPALVVETNIVGSTTKYLTNTMVAVFRNTNGGRMSMFCLADAASPVPTGDNTKANQFNGVDFASNHGYVDALVDRFIMARDTWNSADGGTAQAKMELGAGIFNANTAILGDQENGNQTNLNYSQGTLIVSNTAVFQVNRELELGYTTADPTDPSTPGDTYGQINIGPGGTVIASNIDVGGVTYASGEVGASDIHGGLNQITLTDGAMLVVSNSIGNNNDLPGSGLGLLSFGGNSTLELFVNGSHTGPYVYVNNLTTSGSGNLIKIGAITNLTFSGGAPVDVPLIQYATGTPHFTLSVPPGYSGTLIDNGPGTQGGIDAVISAGSSKSLVWRGYVNNNWDTTTKNWLDLNTGLHTNFDNLDNVSFDDASGVPTTINLAVSSITPNLITMTNNTLNYVISGSGTIVGSAPMFKTGTGGLDVEANTTLSITVDQGSLTGSGTIFGANIGSGGSMLFSGTISGNVACAGAGTSSGPIQGSVDVQPGGVFTNLNAINSTFTLETNSFMQNSGHINYYTGGSQTSTINAGGYLLNLGAISGDLLQVNGTLEDSSGSAGIQMTQVSINSGATFIPGGNGIGTTYIYPDSVGNTPGRLTLNSGSTTIIRVNPSGPANTQIYSGAMDYGPSQSGQAQNGGTLVITNVGGTPFTAGQMFNIFGYAYNQSFYFDQVKSTGASTNSYPIISPATPGPGLSWDLRQLWPNGYVGVMATPVVTLTNSFTMLGASNIVSTFTWSTNVTPGWVLETQANPLSVGLSNNWSRIPGTWTNTPDDTARGYKMRVFTNNLNTANPAVFYRLVYP